MSTTVPEAPESLPLSAEGQIHAACERFEAAWKADPDRPTRIEDCLADLAEPGRSVLLRELLRVEIHYRRRAGDTPRPADYRARFPALDAQWLARAVAPGADPSPPAGAGSKPFPAAPDGRASGRPAPLG